MNYFIYKIFDSENNFYRFVTKQDKSREARRSQRGVNKYKDFFGEKIEGIECICVASFTADSLEQARSYLDKYEKERSDGEEERGA